jgi:hypothetical protein
LVLHKRVEDAPIAKGSRTTMKKALLILMCVAIPGAASSASGLRMTVESPHFTCEGHATNFSHVAYIPGATGGDLSDAAADGSAPLPCCDGKIGCAQFLSTNTIIRQSTEWHG